MNSKSKGNWKIGLNTSVNKQTLKNTRKKRTSRAPLPQAKKIGFKDSPVKATLIEKVPIYF